MPTRHRVRSVVTGVCLLSGLNAQDLLHYKFDGGCGPVINHAANSPAPASGTIVSSLGSSSSSSWTSGRFGQALVRNGGAPGLTFNYVDSGWVPTNVIGSLSLACWLRTPPGTAVPSVFGLCGDGSGGLIQVISVIYPQGWPAPSFDATNLMTLARAGWTHFACVIDGTALRATYYVNGVAQLSGGIARQVNWTGTMPFRIGTYNGLANQAYDIDEFILVNRAMTAAEVAVLAANPRAADAPFGTSGGPTFAGNGQRPVPGNQAYGFVLTANMGLALAIFGSSRCTMANGTIALPANLAVLHPALAGIQGYVDTNLGSLFFVAPGGPTALPFPLPNLPVLSGYSCYGQVLVFDAMNNQFAGSNALAIGIGQ